MITAANIWRSSLILDNSMEFWLAPIMWAQMASLLFSSVSCLMLHRKHINTGVVWCFCDCSSPKGCVFIILFSLLCHQCLIISTDFQPPVNQDTLTM